MCGYIHAHGGAAILGSPKSEMLLCCQLVLDNDIVAFNVTYRLAPEHRSPAGASDIASAVKFFHENAEDFNINSDELAMGGVSGGGYTTMIASILLAREDKAHLVKLQILENANLGTCLDDAPENTVQQWEKAFRNLVPYDLLATDYETQNKERDPLLYPMYVSLEEAAKLPPTILFTSEFDPVRRSTH